MAKDNIEDKIIEDKKYMKSSDNSNSRDSGDYVPDIVPLKFEPYKTSPKKKGFF